MAETPDDLAAALKASLKERTHMHDGYGGQMAPEDVPSIAAPSMREAAQRAIEMIEDMLPYVPEYFREKWNYDEDLAFVKACFKEADRGEA